MCDLSAVNTYDTRLANQDMSYYRNVNGRESQFLTMVQFTEENLEKDRSLVPNILLNTRYFI
jgi:hypothetical protein